jgi:hypothetical protein
LISTLLLLQQSSHRVLYRCHHVLYRCHHVLYRCHHVYINITTK